MTSDADGRDADKTRYADVAAGRDVDEARGISWPTRHTEAILMRPEADRGRRGWRRM